jgi:chemotaxis protein MotB
MMALFIVLWLMNASPAAKKSVTGYFKDPRGYATTVGSGPEGSGEGLRIDRSTAPELRRVIEQALHRMPDFERFGDHVRLSVTGEGLRVELMENEEGMFFMSGGAEPTARGQALLGVLAAELARMPNTIVVEGHTDARPFRNSRPDKGYGNWELSTDRANAARRLLCAGGLPPERVVEVRGFSDQKLIDPKDPEDSHNRRISIVVRLSQGG